MEFQSSLWLKSEMLLEAFLELSPDEFIIPKKPIPANRLWELFAEVLQVNIIFK